MIRVPIRRHPEEGYIKTILWYTNVDGGTKCIVQACHSQLVRNRKSGKSDSLNYYIMCVMRMINEL